MRGHILQAGFPDCLHQFSDIELVVPFIGDAELLHVGESTLSGVFDKALVSPEKGAGHGGRDHEGVENDAAEVRHDDKRQQEYQRDCQAGGAGQPGKADDGREKDIASQ